MIKKSISILKITITLGIIIYILKFTDFDYVVEIIYNSNKFLLLISFLLLSFMTFLQATRFYWITNYFNIDLKIYESWKNIAIGVLYNQVLPSTIGGDGFRFLNMRELNHDAKNSFKSIIVDRIYGLLGLCLLCGICSFFISNIRPDSKFITIVQILSFASIFIFFTLLIFLKRYFYSLCSKFKILEIINDLHLLSKKRLNFIIIAMSIIIHCLLAIVGFIIIHSLKINIDFWPFTWLFISSLLLSTIPISLGGWGFREGIFILSMSLIGVKSEIAVAISFIYAFETSIIGLIGGIIWSLKFIQNK